MLPNHADLSYFLELALIKNISRASERLGISQPALSQSLKRLEHQVGAELVLRSKSGIVLTRAGKILEKKGRELLVQWQRILLDAESDIKQLVGCYRLGAHPSVALYCFPEILKSLLANHPDLELELVHDLSRRITEDVVSMKVDFAVVVNPVEHPDLVIRPLCRDRVSLWGKCQDGKGIEIEKHHSVLIWDPHLKQSQEVLKLCLKKGVTFERKITTSNLELGVALVEQGVGVGILPGRVARKSGHHIAPLLHSPSVVDRHCLVYRKDVQSTPGAKMLSSFIQNHPLWKSGDKLNSQSRVSPPQMTSQQPYL